MVGLALCGPARAQFTQRVSLSSSGVEGQSFSYTPSVTATGRYVAFTSRSPLDIGDFNQATDIYVRDRETRTTARASLASAGQQGNDDSGSASISAEGRYVAFDSLATNFAVDTNGNRDVFVRDLQSMTTQRVSVSSSGAEGNGFSTSPSISGDGRYVAYWSYASNLVPGDTNASVDIFVRDRQAGSTTRVSVDSSGAQADGDSLYASISADGRYVAFESTATNLVPGDTNAIADLFLHDRQTRVTSRLSTDDSGVQGNGDSMNPAISADGRQVAFVSWSTQLVPGDTNARMDIFVRDLVAGTISRVSIDSEGVQGNGNSLSPAISGDGRYVAFVSYSTNLVPGDTNGTQQADAFLRDRVKGTTTRLNLGPSAIQDNGDVDSLAITADGGFVVFDSDGTNLVPGDTNGRTDVFIRDPYGTSTFVTLCEPGVAGTILCPCGNPPSGRGRGCDNSAATGGAVLSAIGGAFLSEDTIVFSTSGERGSALSILLQGTVAVPTGAAYGQGVRCAAGTMKHLFAKLAAGGSITVPDVDLSEPTISARSAAVGNPILAGESRWYLVYYRDPIVLGGCPSNRTFNTTQTGRVTWWP